ncbi:DUF4389 domain-containing protein [Marinimicrobium sp. C6131]|uniref:DUF4389 domain-containing protein n=1 Tax=Marinimicrobium sp. C6131 TaxID=3022676 RepID=UPI00223E7314|nr:DUF4389 domain-containing protein [Marinimicrobium sp. C6131]UZJ45650.1 DUF4389 domain-containing protein [Marinimicrobium sp. C6131]
MDTESLKTNVTSGKHWLRLVYMLLFAVLLYVAGLVMGVVIVLQFLFALLTGSPNGNLRQFGESLALYIYRVLEFLTYSRDDKPFPFSDWPDATVPSSSTAPSSTAPRRKTRPRAAAASSNDKSAPNKEDQNNTGDDHPRN